MEEVWRRTSDERAPASRPPCGDTVAALCGPAACSAAPASPDQGLTVRFRRQSMLETAGAIAAEAWDGAAQEGYSGPLLAVGIGRGSHGASPACTGTHELRACTGLYGPAPLGCTSRYVPRRRRTHVGRTARGPQQARRRPIGRGQGQLLQKRNGLAATNERYYCRDTAGLLICAHM